MQFRHKQILPITLSRTLGVWEVTLLGVGALLGGGIFTLLGHAAGLAGGGLMFAMIFGAFIAFLNLNSYVSLATTFPEAGGGYLWVKEGIGDMQGFFSGWFSWMAHSVACSLYAASFGVFMAEFLFSFLGSPLYGFSHGTWRLIFSVLVIIIFGFVNLRGVALSGKIGGYISLIILAILAAYIIFGFRKIFFAPEVLFKNFSPLLPFGLAGIMQSSALFYIAFEGSEIQAQTGEEAKDPAKTLKKAMFSSWAIVSILYILIAFVILGATDNFSLPSWQILSQHSDRAIIESAKQFLPFGYALMIFGGLLANIAALNATIYSSSRVLFAMARDRFVLPSLAHTHRINKTPYRAILLSLTTIVFIAIFLPIKDIASAADILFIALFLQLNIAYIELRRKKPEAHWQYIIPFGPALPILAVILYVILGISLFHVSQIAIYFTVFWFLLGLVNYLGYTKIQGRKNLEKEIMFSRASRFREKLGYRVILPVANEENWREFSQIAFAMAREEEGEVLAFRAHEVPQSLPMAAGFNIDHERGVLDKIETAAREAKINIDARLSATRSIPDAILETVKVENGDLLLMGWDGYSNTKGFVFGRKVDVVLHRVKCDLAVTKFSKSPVFQKIFIPVSIDENPNLRFAGKVATAVSKWFSGRITVGMVIPENTSAVKYAGYFSVLEDHIKELKLKTEVEPEIKLIRSNNITSSIIKEGANHDVLMLPASRGRITKVISMGSIPEQVAKHCDKTIIMAKGHRGIIQPIFDYIRSRF